MRSSLRRACLAAALGGSLLVGCERAAVQQSYPPDVLFAGRRPVEGKTETAPPLVAHSEPAAPPLPETALATAPRQRLTGVKASTVKTAEPQDLPQLRTPSPEERAGGIRGEPPSQGPLSLASAAEKAVQ